VHFLYMLLETFCKCLGRFFSSGIKTSAPTQKHMKILAGRVNPKKKPRLEKLQNVRPSTTHVFFSSFVDSSTRDEGFEKCFLNKKVAKLFKTTFGSLTVQI
jgi:hypothetical protein